MKSKVLLLIALAFAPAFASAQSSCALMFGPTELGKSALGQQAQLEEQITETRFVLQHLSATMTDRLGRTLNPVKLFKNLRVALRLGREYRSSKADFYTLLKLQPEMDHLVLNIQEREENGRPLTAEQAEVSALVMERVAFALSPFGRLINKIDRAAIDSVIVDLETLNTWFMHSWRADEPVPERLNKILEQQEIHEMWVDIGTAMEHESQYNDSAEDLEALRAMIRRNDPADEHIIEGWMREFPPGTKFH